MQFNTLLQTFNKSIFSIIGAIAILLLGLVIGRFLSKLTQRILHELEINKIIKKTTGSPLPLEQIISSITKYVIYFIAIILALNQIGLSSKILLVILTIFLILIVAFIILALKDFIPNIIAGFTIQQKAFFKKGDQIKIKRMEGKVIDITITETKIKTKDNEIIIIPNSLITKNIIRKR